MAGIIEFIFSDFDGFFLKKFVMRVCVLFESNTMKYLGK